MRLHLILVVNAVLAAGLAPSVSVAQDKSKTVNVADPREAIVKIHMAELLSDYNTPWGSGNRSAGSGSAFVISGNRILTSAHMVANATYILAQKYGSSERVQARTLFVSNETDLALLTVDEPGFFDSVEPLVIGDVPELQDEVAVLGYPTGGEALSITRGVLSRLEHERYQHANTFLLIGQIGSTIDLGNSGGPVIANGKVAGVAMQVTGGLRKTGEMVPVQVIKQFLADVQDGRLDGVPQAAFTWQRFEAAELRRMYGLPASESGGILVRSIKTGTAAARVLRPGDVILKISGDAIGTDGRIEFRSHERTAFYYDLQTKQVGESVELDVWREGKPLGVTLLLDRPLGWGVLVRGPLYGMRPRYYTFGGLTFCPLTVNYLTTWGDDWPSKVPRHLMNLLDHPASSDGQEPVALCNVLRAEINRGYENNEADLIVEADGKKVENLSDLVGMIRSKSDGVVVLKTQDENLIAIDRKRALQEGPEILARYDAPANGCSEEFVVSTEGLSGHEKIKASFRSDRK
ncbi:MAG: hypothetical protein RL681_87 [Candidatus Parcubacteria bacterium]|jgi:S1-C subfamily serine protease